MVVETQEKIIYILAVFATILLLPFEKIHSQSQINVTAKPIELKSSILLSPQNVTILTNSTFDVSFVLDTEGNSVNTVELNIKFPADKLEIVKPAKDKSFFSIWLESPVYSNILGTARFVGVIPNGITTQNGVLIVTTFKAKMTGKAIISVLPTSRVLANDGLGTEINVNFGRGEYTIMPRPPEGPKVFSQTHPFEDRWYNNKNPIISWEKEAGGGG